ncbi:hypothetical protein E3N88_17864 [Mikania micrantha]|uniref:Uncharacterized protein n=1 Tax=Mikania micrantha TaxID=192012 RepID=A0A5N6NVT1_9ASTR|nr:hypothetical protein E3N88_17864 [Mikania micrantha]
MFLTVAPCLVAAWWLGRLPEGFVVFMGFQFNANLMEKNKKRKTKDMEVLLANEASEAQDWIVESDIEEFESEVMGDNESLENRRRSRLRELDEEEFVSEDEEEFNNEVEYESNRVNINKQCGDVMEEET